MKSAFLETLRNVQNLSTKLAWKCSNISLSKPRYSVNKGLTQPMKYYNTIQCLVELFQFKDILHGNNKFANNRKLGGQLDKI